MVAIDPAPAVVPGTAYYGALRAGRYVQVVAADAELKALRRLSRARAAVVRGLTESLQTIIRHLPTLRRHLTGAEADPVLVDMEKAALLATQQLAELATEPTRKRVHGLANTAGVLAAGVEELQHVGPGPEATNLLALMAKAATRSRRQFKALRSLLR